MAKKVDTPPEPYPSAPEHLSPKAQKIWSTIGPAKVRTDSRRVLFEQALTCLDGADQARTAIQVEGLISITKGTAVAHIHPLVKIELQHRAMFHKAWCALGLNAVVLVDPFNASQNREEIE